MRTKFEISKRSWTKSPKCSNSLPLCHLRLLKPGLPGATRKNTTNWNRIQQMFIMTPFRIINVQFGVDKFRQNRWHVQQTTSTNHPTTKPPTQTTNLRLHPASSKWFGSCSTKRCSTAVKSWEALLFTCRRVGNWKTTTTVLYWYINRQRYDYGFFGTHIAML